MPLKRASGSVVEQKSEFDANTETLAAVTDKPVVLDQEVKQTPAADTTASASVADTAATATATVADTATTQVVEEAAVTTQATETVTQQRHEEPAQRQQEVAARTTSTAVATAQPSTGMGQRMDELANEGYEGLELGFGAFPSIVLNSEGQLQTGDGKLLGDHIIGTVDASKQKFLVKNTKCDKREEDFFYVFDQNWATNPKAIDSQGRNPHDKIKEWEAKGWGYEVKKYLDLCVILTRPATEASGVEILSEGDMVLVQIPKTSISRFSGYAARAGLAALRSAPTKFSVGQKITGVDYPYYPWDFRKA